MHMDPKFLTMVYGAIFRQLRIFFFGFTCPSTPQSVFKFIQIYTVIEREAKMLELFNGFLMV